jgi:hypothetical protein
MAYYGDFDFESEAKYATETFEESFAGRIKKKRAELEELEGQSRQPIIFASTFGEETSHKTCSNCERVSFNPDQKVCPACLHHF